jgi:hypothetical protein
MTEVIHYLMLSKSSNFYLLRHVMIPSYRFVYGILPVRGGFVEGCYVVAGHLV